MPTATTYTANLAPADMRERYMFLFSLTWGVAQDGARIHDSAETGVNLMWLIPS